VPGDGDEEQGPEGIDADDGADGDAVKAGESGPRAAAASAPCSASALSRLFFVLGHVALLHLVRCAVLCCFAYNYAYSALCCASLCCAAI
jgi:hypothetical protein